jgi:hypothetical protein
MSNATGTTGQGRQHVTDGYANRAPESAAFLIKSAGSTLLTVVVVTLLAAGVAKLRSLFRDRAGAYTRVGTRELETAAGTAEMVQRGGDLHAIDDGLEGESDDELGSTTAV